MTERGKKTKGIRVQVLNLFSDLGLSLDPTVALFMRRPNYLNGMCSFFHGMCSYIHLNLKFYHIVTYTKCSFKCTVFGQHV